MSDAGFGAPDTSRGPGRKTGKRRSGLASAFFLAVLSVAVYVPALRVPFLMDDQAILIENPSIRRARNVLKFLWPRYWREDHPDTSDAWRVRVVTTMTPEGTLEHRHAGLEETP